VESLGATLLATRDETTGEIVCPDYTYESHLDAEGAEVGIRRGLIEHMRFAHGMVADDDLSLVDAITLHGRAHDPASGVTKGGFPHRHVPEDLKLITGIDRR